MCLHENAFWFTKFLTACKHKISKLAPYLHCAIDIMFIIIQNSRSFTCCYVCKYHKVTLAENDAAAYTPCVQPHRKLIVTAILLKFSQTNL